MKRNTIIIDNVRWQAIKGTTNAINRSLALHLSDTNCSLGRSFL